MVKVYVDLIIKGLKTIEQVPEGLKKDVMGILGNKG